MRTSNEGLPAPDDDPGAAVRRAADVLRAAAPRDVSAEARVLAAVRGRPVPRRRGPVLAVPGVRSRPIWRWVGAVGVAGLAATVALMLGHRGWPAAGGPVGTVPARSASAAGRERPPAPRKATGFVAAPAHTVRFVLSAPTSARAVVVGDFNGWDLHATAMHRDPRTGRWTAEVALPAGRYVYAYVLDGRRWMADPAAALAPGDGFGTPSSVVVVSPAASPISSLTSSSHFAT